MMPLKLQTAVPEHTLHVICLFFALFNSVKVGEVKWSSVLKELILREGLLDVDPASEVVRKEQFLRLGFFEKMFADEVTAGHEDEFRAE